MSVAVYSNGRFRLAETYPRWVQASSNTDTASQVGDVPHHDDWEGLGDLLSLATDQLIAPVEGMHRAIAARWLGLGGQGIDPLRRAYDGLTANIYTTVRFTGSAIGMAVGVGAKAASRRTDLRPLWHSNRGGRVQSLANAIWGDKLEDDESRLEIELGIRDSNGRLIPPNPAAMASAFPQATSRIVVLLHGWGDTERSWQRSSTHLGNLLAAESLTPIYLRYNSGRGVSDNGDGLSDLLEETVAAWPVAVDEVALIGHSMGGLVARSSVQSALFARRHWANKVRHIVTLGSPHLGTPWEKAVALIEGGLNLVSETRPIAEFLNGRSAGLKDLRVGPDPARDQIGSKPEDATADIFTKAGVEQHFLAGVVTSTPSRPLGRLVGDLVVRTGSATGTGRQRQVESTDVIVLNGRRHTDLLHDPAAHEHIRHWLSSSGEARRASRPK